VPTIEAQKTGHVLVRFGKANAPAVHQEWLERCDEGCRCIPVAQDAFEDVTFLAEETHEVESFQDALVLAAALVEVDTKVHGADVVMVTVHEAGGMNLIALGWHTVTEAVEALEARTVS
jgi:uncharacterized protein (DUF111 family)